MISSQIITVQIKDKAKIDDCYFDCCSGANWSLQSGSGKEVSRVTYRNCSYQAVNDSESNYPDLESHSIMVNDVAMVNTKYDHLCLCLV